MVLPEEGFLLRIFIGESDKYGHMPLSEWLVLKAREMGLAGATVTRGMMGFGAHSRLHTFKIERLSEDLPVVVEIVETKEKLDDFLALIDKVIPEGLATMEKVSSGSTGAVRRSHPSLQGDLLRIRRHRGHSPFLLLDVEVGDFLQWQLQVLPASGRRRFTVRQQEFPGPLEHPPLFFRDPPNNAKFAIQWDRSPEPGREFNGYPPNLIFSYPDRPSDRLIQKRCRDSAMEPPRIALVLVPASEEGHELAVLQFEEPGGKSGGILQPADEAHFGVLLLARNAVVHHRPSGDDYRVSIPGAIRTLTFCDSVTFP
jgi:PII-like signaling protein